MIIIILNWINLIWMNLNWFLHLSEFFDESAVVLVEFPSGFGDADADHPSPEGGLVIRTQIFNKFRRFRLQFRMFDAESEIRRRLVFLPPANSAVHVIHIQRCQTHLHFSKFHQLIIIIIINELMNSWINEWINSPDLLRISFRICLWRSSTGRKRAAQSKIYCGEMFQKCKLNHFKCNWIKTDLFQAFFPSALR